MQTIQVTPGTQLKYCGQTVTVLEVYDNYIKFERGGLTYRDTVDNFEEY